ncbi:NRDE family protein [Marinobacter gelidimuriae]|uniref:NRDE family protein n=1 Tax=Marinobacter gelidimuriae TaxID=2739064 RepID=UPI00037CE0D0|nr:NRDE family protein [Marinobacter gelidimuriae]
MCLIAFTLGQNRHYPLVVAANRDEFFNRPTAAMDWWTGASHALVSEQILAGRDLQAGGTWLAISASGVVSAVTNVREGSPEPGVISRGDLPLRALQQSPQALRKHLADNASRYSGFNLVTLDAGQERAAGPGGWYFSNRDAHPGRSLHRGCYGVSNHLLQTPWPKLLRLRQRVTNTVIAAGEDSEPLHQALINHLKDSTPAPDHLLPRTGVGLTTERMLSPAFIIGEHYGTRVTTVVTVAASGEIRVTEQTWQPGGKPAECRQLCWQQ